MRCSWRGPDTAQAPEWSRDNNAAILIGFLGVSIALEGVGLLSLMTTGAEAALFAGVLLSLATFLLVFAVLLLLPRFIRRRGRSYRLLAAQPIDVVETALRQVLEEGGRTVRVEVGRPHRRQAPRIVSAEGLDWWIRLEPWPGGSPLGSHGYRTEIVQVGARLDRDELAVSLRERIATNLSPGEA